MILKKQVYQPTKKTNPIIGFILFLISVLLFILTAPLGFIYGILHSLFAKGIGGIGEYLLKIAISIDQLGNVLMQHLLNLLWVKKGGYKFGNRDETISSAIGRNKRMGTLTRFGSAIDKVLDFIDPNHSLNSIDYYIEPSNTVIDKLGWILIRDNKILCVRSKDKKLFYLPGGKREQSETDIQALSREIMEELSVDLQLASIKYAGVFEAQADGKKPGVLVKMTCFTGAYTGNLQAAAEIAEIAWLGYDEKGKTSKVNHLIFDNLKENGHLI